MKLLFVVYVRFLFISVKTLPLKKSFVQLWNFLLLFHAQLHNVLRAMVVFDTNLNLNFKYLMITPLKGLFSII